MKKKFKSLFVFSAAVAVLLSVASGCARHKDDGGVGGQNQAGQKPLPPECGDKVGLQLFWGPSPTVFQYSVSVGYNAAMAFSVDGINGINQNYTVNLTRGNTYHVTATRIDVDQSQRAQSVEQYIPLCDERVEWYKAHLDYEEPLFRRVLWQ